MAAASGRGGGGRSRAAPAWETQGGVRICIGEAAREAPDGGRGAAACGAELLQRGRCRAAGGAAQVRPRWRRKAAARSAAFSAAVLLLFTRQRDLAAAAFLVRSCSLVRANYYTCHKLEDDLLHCQTCSIALICMNLRKCPFQFQS
ncbi:hypothetical protein EJB05_34233, partial [Eragrostis curvula]